MDEGIIDLYCERLGAGLWAEPINAITNLSFLIAAIATWRLARHLNSSFIGIWVLIALMVAIGLGSGLFHTVATNWARILDVLPILLFQVAFLWLYGQRIIKLPTSYLTGVIVLFLVFAFTARQFPQVLNGSLIYAPAFMLLLGLGFYHYRFAQYERTILLWATGVFSLSLFFRAIDLAICTYIPIGTHYFWHLLPHS